MNMDLIKQLVEDTIPLDMNCQVNRSRQSAHRANLRISIESLLRTAAAMYDERGVPYDPRDIPVDSPKMQYK